MSRFWRALIGPRGLTPAQVAFRENGFAALAATDEWKKYPADNLLIADFTKSREAVKFLDAEEAEYWALLTELGLAK